VGHVFNVPEREHEEIVLHENTLAAQARSRSESSRPIKRPPAEFVCDDRAVRRLRALQFLIFDF
jgi:hypothetical protein